MNVNKINWPVFIVSLVLVSACSPSGTKKTVKMNTEESVHPKGSYGYDVAFFEENNIHTIELKDEESEASVLLAPDYQGRVMTSSANGSEGYSLGWINYDLIRSGEVNNQFNPVGGEERFWIGPEGGPFSIYFKEGEEQIFKNWKVPPVIDTESFAVKDQGDDYVILEKTADLKNASGTEFHIAIERKVSLLGREELAALLNSDLLEDNFDVVAYQSENIMTNTGDAAWTKEDGLLSIWLLCMFNPSPSTTVFIPYNENTEGKIVNDEYFGKVPSDRLIVENGTVFFKIDGNFRSKIGLPPGRAKNLCGSYDSEKNILTLLWCSLPSEPQKYVNSNWGPQVDPYDGDVINSYNDGPVEDGSIMGPFYEIETSSPAAALKPGEGITHVQRVIHMQGEKTVLTEMINELLGLDLNRIESKFK